MTEACMMPRSRGFVSLRDSGHLEVPLGLTSWTSQMRSAQINKALTTVAVDAQIHWVDRLSNVESVSFLG
jgi:hypothetical protein